MTTLVQKIACIGECMVEITSLPDERNNAKINFGGDTLNTAIYLARLLRDVQHDVHYVTLLGDDPYADIMVSAWQGEGIQCGHVEQVSERETGLYVISLDDEGERSFNYWRSNAPARELFEGDAGAKRIVGLKNSQVLFFSGISLAILHEESRERLLELAQFFKDDDRMVVYDTNYRSQLWQGNDAQIYTHKALQVATIALPSDEDLEGVFRDNEMNWKSFLDRFSIPEIILKHGGKSVDIFSENKWQTQSLEKVRSVVDTTAAGDSFNAAYLAARLHGHLPVPAATRAHSLACQVIQHYGAIMPLSAMTKIDLERNHE